MANAQPQSLCPAEVLTLILVAVLDLYVLLAHAVLGCISPHDELGKWPAAKQVPFTDGVLIDAVFKLVRHVFPHTVFVCPDGCIAQDGCTEVWGLAPATAGNTLCQ